MKQQNYSNHTRWVPIYHFLTSLAIIVLLIGSIVNLVNSSHENLYSASLLVLVSLILIFLFLFSRGFALKAQDRAIRAEERFRYYILTGKTLDDKLTIRQIIGLRFASDEEYAALAEKAVKENLSEKQIKMQIKNWKPDYDRA